MPSDKCVLIAVDLSPATHTVVEADKNLAQLCSMRIYLLHAVEPDPVLKKMLPPNHKTIPEISKEEGICDGTLYNWRKAARAEGRLMPDGDSR
jgi:hypothetical protein